MTQSTSDEPAFPARDGGLVRFRLGLAYDGTGFSGWARQPGRRSVQGDVEDALDVVLRLPDPPRLTVAGRTDAGVHATGQVAHVDLPGDVVLAFAEGRRARGHGPGTEPPVASAHVPAGTSPRPSDRAVPAPGVPAGTPRTHPDTCTALLRALNGVLAADVRVTGLGPAPDGFDARFSALHRRYVYRLTDVAYGALPLRRHDTAWHDRPLDVDAMQAAATALLGLHDFRAFCKRRDGATTVRALQELSCRRETDVIAITVQADAFCHSMVRSLVGALTAVGEGRRPPTWPAELLTAPQRSSAVSVAPAHGLTLVAVAYPSDALLAARADETRAVRADPGAVDA